MPWRRFILVVVVGAVLVPASIFSLGPRVVYTTQEVTAHLLSHWPPDVLNAFLVDVPALALRTVPGVVVAVWLALRRPFSGDCRCRRCRRCCRGPDEVRLDEDPDHSRGELVEAGRTAPRIRIVKGNGARCGEFPGKHEGLGTGSATFA